MIDSDEIRLLVNAFPAVFGQTPVILHAEIELATELQKMVSLTGYLQAGETDTHGHYIAPKEEVPVIHDHRGGRRAHSHEKGDTNGNHNSQ